jgi:hypothetical protein
MNMRRTLLICVKGLLWLFPLIAIFSGKLITPILIIGVLWLAVWGRAQLRQPSFWQELAQSPYGRITVLLLVWPLLMAWHSITPERSVSTALSIFVTLLMGGIASLLAERPHSPRMPMVPLVSSLLVAIIVPALLVVQEYALDWQGLIRLFFEFRTTSALEANEFYNEFIEKSYNRSLCLVALAIWPCVYGLWTISRRWLACALPLLMLPILTLMQSSAAVLALSVGIFIFHAVRCLPTIIPRLLSFALVGFFIVWPLALPTLFNTLAPGTEMYDALPRSAQHRMMIWDFVLDHVQQKPWLGWGLDTSRAIPGGLDECAPGMVWLPLHPHNSILQLLLEEGIVGFVLSLAALGMVLGRWISLSAMQPLCGAVSGAALFGFMVIGFTAFGVWQTWWMAAAWLLWLLIIQVRHSDIKRSTSV